MDFVLTANRRNAMPAYVISQLEARDPSALARYRELAAASIARHGGRYLVRGGRIEVAEGVLPAQVSLVIVEFPDMATLRAWYSSPDYGEALAVRKDALDRTLLFVEGCAQPE